jgi:hypothetical protein
MRTEREFLDEVFSAEPGFEARLLENTLQYARRRKQRRHVVRTVAMALVLCCAGLIAFLPARKTRPVSEAPAPGALSAEAPVLPGTSIRLLTDEELLEVFAGRPVAIIGSGDQRQLVVLDTFRQSNTRLVN